jgi:hypothetical protein
MITKNSVDFKATKVKAKFYIPAFCIFPDFTHFHTVTAKGP